MNGVVTKRGRTLTHAFTVDVEDWAQSSLDPELPVTDRFLEPTRRILDALAESEVHGTFFVLGLAAQKAPQLVREIFDAGHEVQSHGFGHRLLSTLTPAQFLQDIDRGRKLLEDLLGVRVTGYRAPAFGITERTLWALDLLVDCGFEYDSSIFPVKLPRYGMQGAWRIPHRLATPKGRSLIEVPVASYRGLGRAWPTGGGGYFRLLPYAILRRGLTQLEHSGHSSAIYVHPHEFDVKGLSEQELPIPWTRRVHQGWGRRTVPGKIRRLFREFAFGRLRDVIASSEPLPCVPHARTDAESPRAVVMPVDFAGT